MLFFASQSLGSSSRSFIFIILFKSPCFQIFWPTDNLLNLSSLLGKHERKTLFLDKDIMPNTLTEEQKGIWKLGFK